MHRRSRRVSDTKPSAASKCTHVPCSSLLYLPRPSSAPSLGDEWVPCWAQTRRPLSQKSRSSASRPPSSVHSSVQSIDVDVQTYTQMIMAACTRLPSAQVKVGVVELNRRSSPVTSHTTPLSCLISQLKSALLNYFSRANNDSGSPIGELPHQSTEISPSQLLFKSQQ